MSSIDYSTTYELILTMKKGMKLIVDKTDVNILDCIDYSDLTLTEISERTKIPKEEVEKRLEKLIDEGVIGKIVTWNGRHVSYYVSGMTIFCSEQDNTLKTDCVKASAERILKNGVCTIREDFCFFSAILAENGMNNTPGLFAIGPSLLSGLTEDELSRRDLNGKIEEQLKNTPVSFDLRDEDEKITLTFKSKNTDISDVPLFLCPMMGVLISRSKLIFGYELERRIEYRCNDNSSEFSITFFRSDQPIEYERTYDLSNTVRNPSKEQAISHCSLSTTRRRCS